MTDGIKLDAHHRKTVDKLFTHPTSHNIQWHDVLSMLRAVADVDEVKDGRYKVTLGPETETFDAPKGTDIVELLDSRRFVDGLATLDPANGAAVAAYITKYMTDNPTTGVRYAGGAGDVRAQGDPAGGSAKTFDDLIRGR